MTAYKTDSQKGFIALIGATIISIILLEISLSAGESTFSARLGILDREMKTLSKHRAESCIAATRLRLVEQYSYSPAPSGEIIPLGSDTCTIVSVSFDTEDTVLHQKTATVTVRGGAHNSLTNLQAEIVVKNPAFAFPAHVSRTEITWTKEI